MVEMYISSLFLGVLINVINYHCWNLEEGNKGKKALYYVVAFLVQMACILGGTFLVSDEIPMYIRIGNTLGWAVYLIFVAGTIFLIIKVVVETVFELYEMRKISFADVCKEICDYREYVIEKGITETEEPDMVIDLIDEDCLTIRIPCRLFIDGEYEEAAKRKMELEKKAEQAEIYVECDCEMIEIYTQKKLRIPADIDYRRLFLWRLNRAMKKYEGKT